MSTRRTHRWVPTSVLVAVLVAGCGKVPPPDQVLTDTKAEQKKNLCLAWQYGGPRQTLTAAAHGGAEHRALAELLLPAWSDRDPDDLEGAFGVLHEAASRLKRGERAETVLADAEASMAATDRYFDTECPPVIAGERPTTSPG